jgi:DNA-binding transcriptional LysR family regulator
MSGNLLVGASSIPGEYVLPALMGRFRDKYPDVTVTLLIGDSQAVVDWVVDGRVELGVVGNRLVRRGVEYRELMPDDVVVVVPAGHAWAGRPQVSLAELRAEPMIIRERGSGTRAALEQALGDAGSDLSQFRVVAEMGSTQAIKQAVRAGLGVSVMSRRSVEDEWKAGQVAGLKISDLPLARSFHVAVHRDRSRSPLAEAFRNFLEAEAL